jgi:hypothetical protein
VQERWKWKGDNAVDAYGGKIGFLGTIELVKAQAKISQVDLKVEDGGLNGFLVLVVQSGQAIDKGIGDPEFHIRDSFKAPTSSSATCSLPADWFKYARSRSPARVFKMPRLSHYWR